jgi:hypothetical protein
MRPFDQVLQAAQNLGHPTLLLMPCALLPTTNSSTQNELSASIGRYSSQKAKRLTALRNQLLIRS